MLDPVALDLLAILINDGRCCVCLAVTGQELEVIPIIQLGTAVMDEPCVMGDQAVLCLAEYLVQHCDRHKAALNQFLEHIPCAYAGQLVRVTDQDGLRPFLQRGKELACKPHIHHGELVHNDQIRVQAVLFSAAAALILLTDKPKAAVKGACPVKSGTLRHPAACPARRRHKDDLPVGMHPAVNLQDDLQNGRLARTRRTGDDGQVIKKCRQDCGFLLPGSTEALFCPDRLNDGGNVFCLRPFLRQKPCDPAGSLILLRECIRVVDAVPHGDHGAAQDHSVQFPAHFLLAHTHFRKRDLFIQHLKSCLAQFFPSQKQMPLLSLCLVQCAVERAPDPHGVTGAVIGFPYNGIHPAEPETRYLAQLEWAFFQNIQTGRPEMLVDLQRRLRRQLKGRKERHDIPQHPALRKRSPDILQFVFCYPPDLQQPFRVLFQYVQRICAELCHDLSGSFLPDPFDKAGTEIAQHAFLCPRYNLTPLLHLELHAVFPVDPFPFQFQLHGIRHGDLIAHSGETDQVVFIPSLIPCLFRDGSICGLHNDNAEFI